MTQIWRNENELTRLKKRPGKDIPRAGTACAKGRLLTFQPQSIYLGHEVRLAEGVEHGAASAKDLELYGPDNRELIKGCKPGSAMRRFAF